MTPIPDIHDIHGPLEAAAHHAWWLYAVTIAALAAIAYVIVGAVRRRRARLTPADVAALRALDDARDAIERVDPRTFSTQVSKAVRDYVELAFGVRAPRLTTEELLADLMTDDSRVATHRAELGRFLEFCDLAKYARWSLSRAEMTGMLDSAEIFVRATAQGAS